MAQATKKPMRGADLLSALQKMDKGSLGCPIVIDGGDGYAYDVVGISKYKMAGGLDHRLVIEKSKRPRSHYLASPEAAGFFRGSWDKT